MERRVGDTRPLSGTYQGHGFSRAEESRFYAPRNYYDAVWRLQRTELLDHQEPQDDAGPVGDEEVLQPVPQAYATQRSEVTPFCGHQAEYGGAAGVILSEAKDL